jgi:monofunctional biosynthetic peptidoglycan transglycosylase
MRRHLFTLGKFIASLWLVLFVYNTLFPPISTLMIARVLTFRAVERDYVPLKHISPHLVRAVIAAEDGRFCDHHGVDWQAMRHVVAEAVDDEGVSGGGSTITMQTTKNLFLWMGLSYVRKPIEMPLATLLDAVWSKRRIMENYLNVAEFGRGIFGAEAAARHYFKKAASNLTAREAALLAAILPSPRKRNAAKPTGYVSRYANNIARRMPAASSACVLR